MIFALLESFGQTKGNATLVEDVTLVKGSPNFSYLEYLIAILHPGFPKRRSLLKFQNVPRGCQSVSNATMYLYIYMCIHTRPVICLMLKFLSSLVPYKLTECSSHGRRVRLPVLKGIHTTISKPNGSD